ncbi:DUF7537 family lipoprotein [Halovenus halobia]|uniref:DUF7537 family lipoprotein n=1 Tax=Halovenus halobia TaxID=3396622 RepID=UPI003F57FF01
MRGLTPRRRKLLVVAVLALAVALAGCGSSGGSDPTDSDDNSADSPDPDNGPGDSGNGTSDGPVEEISDVALTGEDAASVESFTIRIETAISSDGETVTENRTLRVGSDGHVYGVTRRSVPDANNSVTVTESYRAEQWTFLRHTVPDSDGSTYERVRIGETAELSGVERLDNEFDFVHERTGEQRHRFTVNSTDQVVGDGPSDGTLENVSVTVVVEDGLITELDYKFVTATDEGTMQYETHRTVSDRGQTSVSEPDWLTEARGRTPPTRADN